MNERPEWARGAEWDGWTNVASPDSCVSQNTDPMTEIIICSDGRVYISQGDGTWGGGCEVMLPFPSPEAARVAAMAIIEGMK